MRAAALLLELLIEWQQLADGHMSPITWAAEKGQANLGVSHCIILQSSHRQSKCRHLQHSEKSHLQGVEMEARVHDYQAPADAQQVSESSATMKLRLTLEGLGIITAEMPH